ncbi:rod shape-determining protein MreD [Ruegeria marina]|uniref:Rod shape-determining protein MreD n=1 Tax=Ruegeria marina TaxID=639004 RepID=A0A1G6M1W4_9RHOB|nr:rod shape-determining protein MreD [Ruegeria marina]SDC48975.1 rod shape-determining protein MreD [Ruegeria marina]
MDNFSPSRIWIMRLVYIGIALAILFFQLLPLDARPSRWAGPDFLLAMTLAWTLRRPDYAPALLVALVMLLADLLLQRPPGLLAALTVAASAFLRNRLSGQGETGFIGEWISVSVVLIALALFYRLTLIATAVDRAPLTLAASQVVLTILCYPAVVAASQTLFGVRRLTPSDAEALGAR